MNLIGGAEYVQLKIRSTAVRRKPRLELKVDTPGWAVRMDEREHKRTNAVDNAADLRTKAWSDGLRTPPSRESADFRGLRRSDS